jgi:hypothetical protein
MKPHKLPPGPVTYIRYPTVDLYNELMVGKELPPYVELSPAGPPVEPVPPANSSAPAPTSQVPSPPHGEDRH